MMLQAGDTWGSRLATAFLLLAALVPARFAHAQTAEETAFNQIGFHRERSYFSPESFEHYDTMSGNVMLTFTDLKLPANGGRYLEFQRTFSNKVPVTPVISRTSRWSFGFPGMVMRIVEKDAPPPTFSFNDDPERIIPTTPIFVTADGAAHVTLYAARPFANNPATMRMVISGEFYKYDRQARTLYMPDGTICYYEDTVDAQGRPERVLREFVDPFGNRVELLRSEGMIAVRQHFGGQYRDIYLEVDAASRVRKMTFEHRTWTYEHEYGSGGMLDITAVRMPAGPGWTFEYAAAAADLTDITTPNGGRIEYTYDDIQVFTRPPDPEFYFWTHVLKFRDAYDRGGVHLGQWELHWSNPSEGADFSWYTLIDLPNGSTVSYGHSSTAPLTSGRLFTGGFGVVRREDSLELEQLTYVAVPVVRYTSAIWFGTPELQKREVTRNGRKYTTDYEYAADTASFPWAFHRPTRIIETNDAGRLRTTVRTYTNRPSSPSPTSQARYILGLSDTETLTVGTESLRRSWSYDNNGFKTGVNDFSRPPSYNGIRTFYGADEVGNIRTVTEGNYTATTYSYQWGQVSEIKTAEHTTTREVDPDSNVRSETRGGRRAEFDYDDLFRVKEVRPPGGTEPTVTDHLTGNGEWVKTSRGSQFLTTNLNGFGRPVGTINSQDVRTTIRYDEQARVIYRGYPFKDGPDIGTQIDYDLLGRIVRETNPDGSYRERTYGPDRVTLRDEEGRQTVHGTESFGNPDESRLAWMTDAKDQTWGYGYSATGRLRVVAHPDGTSRTFEYNDQNLLWRETHPESGVTTYTYDNAGNLSQKTDANGTPQAFTYDSNNRPTRITSGTKITEVRYEPGTDNRHWVSNGTASTNFFYDLAGRMDHRQDSVGGYVFDTVYRYDGNDRVREITYPSNRHVQYDVDSEGQITRVFEIGETGRDYAFGMTYHPSGALATYTTGNLVPTTLTYDDQRYWIRSITSGALQLAYDQYDAVGNPRLIVDARPEMSETLTFDALNRLETADNSHHSIHYVYDAHGNRQTANGSTYEYETGTLRLSNQNGTPFAYFNNGNLRTAGGNQYTYTPENLLETATMVGGTAMFGYDGDGWRVRKTAPGDTTWYVRGLASEVLTELHTTASTIRVRDYVYAGNRLLSAVERVAPRFSDCGGTARPDGTPQPITIATPGGTASVPFQGSGCRHVSVLVNVTSGSLGCAWSVEVRNAATNALVGTTAGSCGSAGLLEPVTLPADGDYVAIVRASSTGSGSATVRIYDVVDVATPISTNGVPVQADLLTPGQNARLPFNGTQGQRFSAWTNVASGAFGCAWKIEIRNANTNALVGAEAGSCGSSAFLEPVTLPSTDAYVLIVNPTSFSTGTAAVHLYNIVDVATPITPTGAPVTVDLTMPGVNARLPFASTQGRRMSVWVNVINGSFGCVWNVEIRNAASNALIGNNTGSCGSTAFLEPVTIPADGNYVVVVTPTSSSVGRATVRLYDVVDDTTAITPGSAVAIDLTIPGRNTRLPFSGLQGQRMSAFVNTTSGAFGCVWYVEIRYAVSDALVGTSAGSCGSTAFLEPVILPADGSYVVVVNPSAASTGTVTVLLSAVVDFTGTITPNGPSVPISLMTPGQAARLSFDGIGGRKVTATASVTSGAFGCVWYIRILNSTGGVLGETGSCGSSATRGPLTLPSTGSYTVMVDPGTAATGNVTVTLTDTP